MVPTSETYASFYTSAPIRTRTKSWIEFMPFLVLFRTSSGQDFPLTTLTLRGKITIEFTPSFFRSACG